MASFKYVYNLQKNLAYYLQNLRVCTGKNIVINFEIIKLKIKTTWN